MRTSGRRRSRKPGSDKTAEAGGPGIYTYPYKRKEYRVDDKGFLLFPQDWDDDFADGNAASVGITDGLTDQHWKVIKKDGQSKVDILP